MCTCFRSRWETKGICLACHTFSSNGGMFSSGCPRTTRTSCLPPCVTCSPPAPPDLQEQPVSLRVSQLFPSLHRQNYKNKLGLEALRLDSSGGSQGPEDDRAAKRLRTGSADGERGRSACWVCEVRMSICAPAAPTVSVDAWRVIASVCCTILGDRLRTGGGDGERGAPVCPHP